MDDIYCTGDREKLDRVAVLLRDRFSVRFEVHDAHHADYQHLRRHRRRRAGGLYIRLEAPSPELMGCFDYTAIFIEVNSGLPRGC